MNISRAAVRVVESAVVLAVIYSLPAVLVGTAVSYDLSPKLKSISALGLFSACIAELLVLLSAGWVVKTLFTRKFLTPAYFFGAIFGVLIWLYFTALHMSFTLYFFNSAFLDENQLALFAASPGSFVENGRLVAALAAASIVSVLVVRAGYRFLPQLTGRTLLCLILILGVPTTFVAHRIIVHHADDTMVNPERFRYQHFMYKMLAPNLTLFWRHLYNTPLDTVGERIPGGCTPFPRTIPPAHAGGMNVVFIAADLFHFGGFGAQSFPNLARLLQEGLVFDRVYTASVEKDYDAFALDYSRYPLRNESRRVRPQPEAAPRMEEIFRELGYDTSPFVVSSKEQANQAKEHFASFLESANRPFFVKFSVSAKSTPESGATVEQLLEEVEKLLRRTGKRDTTVLAFTGTPADIVFGTKTLRDAHTRSLFVLRFPNPREIDRTILKHPGSRIDFLPTIVDALGFDTRPELQGRSLLNPMHAPVFISTQALTDMDAMIVWPWKLIQNNSTYTFELFNLETDPDEKIELSAQHPSFVECLVEELRWFRGRQLWYYGTKANESCLPPIPNPSSCQINSPALLTAPHPQLVESAGNSVL